jgi:hypothetical protein
MRRTKNIHSVTERGRQKIKNFPTAEMSRKKQNAFAARVRRDRNTLLCRRLRPNFGCLRARILKCETNPRCRPRDSNVPANDFSFPLSDNSGKAISRFLRAVFCNFGNFFAEKFSRPICRTASKFRAAARRLRRAASARRKVRICFADCCVFCGIPKFVSRHSRRVVFEFNVKTHRFRSRR